MNIMAVLVSMIFLMGWKPVKITLPSVKQEIDKNEVTIGDKLQLQVYVFTDKDQEMIVPENQPFMGKFVVKNRNIRTVTRRGIKRTTLEYELVSYDVGKDTIPEITFLIKENGDTLDLKTLPISVEIKSVAPGLTGEEDLKGIKPQIGIRLSYWYYLISFISITVLVGIVFLLLRKRSQRLILEKIVTTPPWEIALSELSKLSRHKPVTPEEIKHFYTELSFILREYYEAMYDFPALENTTNEIVSYIRKRKEFKPVLIKTHEFLSKSDLVKFAKYIPPSVDNEKEIGMIWDIVEKTKEEEEEEVNV